MEHITKKSLRVAVSATAFFVMGWTAAFANVSIYEYMTISPSSQTKGVRLLTSYIPTSNTVIRARFSAKQDYTGCLFCSRSTSGGTPYFSFWANMSKRFRFDYYNANQSTDSNFVADKVYELEVKDGVATLTADNETVAVLSPCDGIQSFPASYPLRLFQSYMNTTWDNSFKGNFYHIRIYDIECGEEVLKHNFVPCVDDGVVMLCDLAAPFRTRYELDIADGATVTVGGNIIETFGDSRVTATWIGGGSDSLMTTLSNWLGLPASLDLTEGTVDVDIQAGGEMKYSGRTWLASITNSTAFKNDGSSENIPTVIEPFAEDDALFVSGGLVSMGKNQIVLKGDVTLPDGVYGGTAALGNTCAIKYQPAAFRTNTSPVPTGVIEGLRPIDAETYGSAPLVLAGAKVDLPLRIISTYMAVSLLGYENTYNIVNGEFFAGEYQAAIGVMAGATIEFRGGFTAQHLYRFVGSNRIGENAGVVKISRKPICMEKALSPHKNVRIIFDAEGCYAREGISGVSFMMEFLRSGCFRDGTTHVAEWYHTGDNITQLEFNTTTQRFSAVSLYNTNRDSWYHGNYPAMMEVTCEPYGTSTLVSTNAIPINGGLGIHVCGNGTFPLARQNYASCGDLEASAGTLMLCNDATWLNGTNFTARGTGCIKFTKAGQVNSDFAKIRLSDSGTIEIPAGVTLAVQSLEVLSDGEWKVVDSPKKFDASAKGLMSGRIVGGGSLRVLGNRAGGFVVLLK